MGQLAAAAALGEYVSASLEFHFSPRAIFDLQSWQTHALIRRHHLARRLPHDSQILFTRPP
jgi:hypothetical protein